MPTIYHWFLTCRLETCDTQRLLSIGCASFEEALTCLVQEYCRDTTEPWDSIQLTPMEVPHGHA